MRQFSVTMECTVKKCVTCECETEEEARTNPWDYAVNEIEIDQTDFDVIDVTDEGEA